MEVGLKHNFAFAAPHPAVKDIPSDGTIYETVSTSSDSNASEDCANISKAPRYDEPVAPSWQATSPIALPSAELPFPTWTVNQSAKLYNLPGWSEGYYTINDQGNMCVTPRPGQGPSLDLYELTEACAGRGLKTPLMFRCLDIVGDRIHKINAAFATAIQRHGYPAPYNGVFPVKCNHDKDLVQAILDYGAPYGFGLEVGSKSELAMVMAQLAAAPGTNVICNGYKDGEYMNLVLRCRQLGINAIVVLEQFEELDMILDAAATLRVPPVIGVRAKLSTRHEGHWGPTSGDKAKFGLKPAEIVAVVKRLHKAGAAHTLQLLHFHCGSQITGIATVKEVMREAAHLYGELVKLGAGMKWLDVGGGLAVDYDGSFTDTHASMSYTIQQYAHDVVGAVHEVCCLRGIPSPTIISESGRALASHHAILVFDVLSSSGGQPPPAPASAAPSTAAIGHPSNGASPKILTKKGYTINKLRRDNYGYVSEGQATAGVFTGEVDCTITATTITATGKNGSQEKTVIWRDTTTAPPAKGDLQNDGGFYEEQEEEEEEGVYMHDMETELGSGGGEDSTGYLVSLPTLAAAGEVKIKGDVGVGLRFGCSEEEASPDDTWSCITTEKGRLLVASLHGVLRAIDPDVHAMRAAVADTAYFRQEALRAFKLGTLTLEERAHIEDLCDTVHTNIRTIASTHGVKLPEGLKEAVFSNTVSMYHINLSVFRSAVDSWAIHQLFPIMPIHRLREEPIVQATFADLTCDSDGKIDRFINPRGGEPLESLTVHELEKGRPYYMAMCLTGAYQEVMGSVHNMFGSINTVALRMKPHTDTHTTTAADASNINPSSGFMCSSGDGIGVCVPMCASPAVYNQPETPTNKKNTTAGFNFEGIQRLKEQQRSLLAQTTPNPSTAFASYSDEAVKHQSMHFVVESIVPGETTAQVLLRANHYAQHMMCAVRAAVDSAVQQGRLDGKEGAEVVESYVSRMAGYTYMA